VRKDDGGAAEEEGSFSSSGSGSSASGSEEEEGDEERQVKRRGKKQQAAGLDLATVFAGIMSEHLPDNPILSRNGGFAGELKKRKMEKAVERQVAEARRRVREQWHRQPDPHERIEEERRLKKVATAGVVRLFNAVNGEQRKLREAEVPASGKAQRDLQRLTREAFLGALRQASKPKSGSAAAAGPAWLAADYEADREEQRDPRAGGGEGSEQEMDDGSD
jgi:hypothetical protein